MDETLNRMQDIMQEADKKLDTLTYDRILGDIISPSALDVLPDPTEDTTETTTD